MRRTCNGGAGWLPYIEADHEATLDELGILRVGGLEIQRPCVRPVNDGVLVDLAILHMGLHEVEQRGALMSVRGGRKGIRRSSHGTAPSIAQPTSLPPTLL